MGIFDALTTAVSGLGAQAYALQNISGNIANSQTTAYKRINTSFEDLIGDNLPSKQIAGGVLASSVPTNNVQGDLQNVSTPTFMAINGNGYFIVKKPDNFSGNQPVFGGVNLYTRRGDFQMDKSGYLVNNSGYYLMGIPVDPTTGTAVGSIPTVLKFNNNLMPAAATTQVQYNANLPSQPITASTVVGAPASNLLDPLTFVSNPLVVPAAAATLVGAAGTYLQDAAGPTNAGLLAAVGGQTLTVTVGANAPTIITFAGPAMDSLAELETALKAVPGVSVAGTSVVQLLAGATNGKITITAGNTTDVITVAAAPAVLTALGLTNTFALPRNQTVYGVDQTNFFNQSVAGGSITAYDGVGAPVNMQFRWAKIDSAILGPGNVDQWNLFYQVNSNPSNTQPAWLNVGTDFVFDATGQLNPPINSLSLNNVTVDGIPLGTVSLQFGAGGLTQFANSNGTVQVNLLDQNGSPAGQLQSVSVDDQGRVVGTYSNGRIIPLAEITLANFNGQNYLKRLDGGAYAETADSGPALLNATGKIVGSSLESSNSDIADEFSKLIVTQQAYSANTKIITTTSAMVQDLLNVVR
jgi:flagellar hook protein FlgE